MAVRGWSARPRIVDRAPADDFFDGPDLKLEGDLAELTQRFGVGNKLTPFMNAGVMWERQVWTRPVERDYRGAPSTQRCSRAVDRGPESFFVPDEQLERWKYLKGPKDIPRVAKNGHEYRYSEGGIAFPDPIDQPSRTILTGEGGVTPSRFKHVIDAGDGRLRRLTPLELERLNGFPDGWTETGMPDGRRAFMMGNALVVGWSIRVGEALAQSL